MEIQIVDIKGKEVGKMKLPAEVFEVKPSKGFLHEVITNFHTNQRSWTAHTKTRSEVSGGGRKPWKQKHTGNARAGSNRSPLWRKGGIVFGPRFVGSRRVEQPRRKSRLALAQALSSRASQGDLRVVDKLALDGAKTKQVAEFLKALGAAKRSLVVVEQFDGNLARASQNLCGLKVMLASNLNAYEVLACDKLIVTQAALEKIRSRWN